MTGQRHVPVLKTLGARDDLADGAAVALLFAVMLAPWIGILIAGARPDSGSAAVVFCAAILPLNYFVRLWPPWRRVRRARRLLLGGIVAFLAIVAGGGFFAALIDRETPLVEILAWSTTIALGEVASLLGVCLICRKLLQLIGEAPTSAADR
jgi:hypothetical protein